MTEIRVATAAEAADVGRVFAAAFTDDPALSWVFRGSTAERHRKLSAFFGFLAVEALVPLGTAWLTDGAAASWTPPDPAPWPDDRSDRFGKVLDESCEPADVERLGVLGALMGERHPAQPYWYLGVLGVVPESQGQGLGSALLAESLAVVDATGSPAYLESSNDRNVPLYERHGFRTTDVVHLPDGGPPLTLMWRERRT